jgi:hypothetical protein
MSADEVCLASGNMNKENIPQDKFQDSLIISKPCEGTHLQIGPMVKTTIFMKGGQVGECSAQRGDEVAGLKAPGLRRLNALEQRSEARDTAVARPRCQYELFLEASSYLDPSCSVLNSGAATPTAFHFHVLGRSRDIALVNKRRDRGSSSQRLGWPGGETRKKRKQKRITTTSNSLCMTTLVAALDDG